MFIGGVVYFNTSFIFQVAIKYLAFFSISKGVWSIFSSFALGYYFDWMGAVDLIAGISLILINFNVTSGYFSILAVLIGLKGLYSFMLSF